MISTATRVRFAFLSMAIGALVVSSLPASALAADPSLNSQDKSFITDAAEGGLAEIELGRLAQEKAESPKVKDFGQNMIDDHGRASDQLKEIAQKLGVSVPDHVSATQFAEKTKLSAFSGSHFDKSYMENMVKDHRDDIAAFGKEANEGRNPQLKAFASKTLPTLEKHLRMAEQTNRLVGGEADNSKH